jgi:hypothetical protein
VTRATAYFRRAEDISSYHAWAAERGLDHLPVICTRGEICRNNLLFELELDAIQEVRSGGPARSGPQARASIPTCFFGGTL